MFPTNDPWPNFAQTIQEVKHACILLKLQSRFVPFAEIQKHIQATSMAPYSKILIVSWFNFITAVNVVGLDWLNEVNEEAEICARIENQKSKSWR